MSRSGFIRVGYVGGNYAPIPKVELREESGKVRAYGEDGRYIPIPSLPKEGVNIGDWLSGLSPKALEAARMFYSDKWMWESDNEKYREMVALIEGWQHKTGSPLEAGYFYCPYIPVIKTDN